MRLSSDEEDGHYGRQDEAGTPLGSAPGKTCGSCSDESPGNPGGQGKAAVRDTKCISNGSTNKQKSQQVRWTSSPSQIPEAAHTCRLIMDGKQTNSPSQVKEEDQVQESQSLQCTTSSPTGDDHPGLVIDMTHDEEIDEVVWVTEEERDSSASGEESDTSTPGFK